MCLISEWSSGRSSSAAILCVRPAVCVCESAGGEPVQTRGRHIWSSSRVKATVVGPGGTDRGERAVLDMGDEARERVGGWGVGEGGVPGSGATTEEV